MPLPTLQLPARAAFRKPRTLAMGNSYSVVREEQEEQEFQYLVEAVEVAQRRAVQQDDLEAGWRSPTSRVSGSPDYRILPTVKPCAYPSAPPRHDEIVPNTSTTPIQSPPCMVFPAPMIGAQIMQLSRNDATCSRSSRSPSLSSRSTERSASDSSPRRQVEDDVVMYVPFTHACLRGFD